MRGRHIAPQQCRDIHRTSGNSYFSPETPEMKRSHRVPFKFHPKFWLIQSPKKVMSVQRITKKHGEMG